MPSLHLMNRIYLGVDIGGTKSLAWLSDSAGHVLGSGLAGAGGRRGADYSVMAQVLDDITTQATNEAGISAACFGIALIAGTYCNCLGQMEESLP
jgi:Predicted N-acetylglucosamine kinase